MRAGVDLNTIRAWLGHVSLDTTNIYAEIDLEMKAKAMALCDAAEPEPNRPVEGEQGSDRLPERDVNAGDYVAEARRNLLSGTETPPLRNIVTSATYLQRCCMQHLWSHQRRDFIECAAGQVGLTQWCGGWIERIASIYRLNDARLEHYDPGLKRQTSAFDAAQGALNEALDALFAHAERELAGRARLHRR